jgi:hypothetical protein
MDFDEKESIVFGLFWIGMLLALSSGIIYGVIKLSQWQG